MFSSSAREADLLTEGGDAPLELEQTHGHFPAVAGGTDDQVGVGHRIVEEDLVELAGAGDLLDRPDDTRLVERHQQKAEAVVAGVEPGSVRAMTKAHWDRRARSRSSAR